MGDYQEFSLNRAKLALVIGALVGTPLIIIAEMVLGVIPPGPGSIWQLVLGIMIFSLLGFLFAVYGMVFIAVPAWWMLHEAGMTTWVHAVILGVVLTFCYAIGIWFFSLPTAYQHHRVGMWPSSLRFPPQLQAVWWA